MRLHHARAGAGVRFLAITACVFAVLATASAQEVLEQPPKYLRKSPALLNARTNLLATRGDQLTTLAPSSDQGSLRWGPVRLHPHLVYRFSYGDGIQSSPGHASKSAINEISPALLLNVGNHWTFDYTPTLRFYSSSSFQDGTDHSVNLSGATAYHDWTVALSQTFTSSSQPLIETGSQAERQSHNTGINANYHLSQKMSLEMELSQVLMSAQQFTSSSQWSTMDWLDYTFAPRFSGALGLGGGYVLVSAGLDNAYEQVQGRLRWLAGEKLTISLNGGIEYREFLGSGVAPLLHPTFHLEMKYQFTEGTQFSLEAGRTVRNSFFENQVTDNTDVTANIRQRLLKKLILDVNGGYGLSSFVSTTSGLPINREDYHARFSVRLTAPVLKKGTTTVFYRSNENSSSGSGFSFLSSQVGVEVGYHY